MNENVIYKITSKIKGIFYIGSAKFFNRRKNIHLCELRKNKHNNPRLQNHFNKYGITDFEFSIIEYNCMDLIKREQYFIDTLNPFFNIHKIAQSPKGLKRTPEQIQRMMDGKKIKSGWKMSAEFCKRLSERNKGKKISEKHKSQISNANKGRVVTETVRKNISSKLKGRIFSNTHKKNLSIKAIGNKNYKNIDYKSIERSNKIRNSLSIKILQIKDNVIIKEWGSGKQAAISLNLSRGNISACINNKRKNAGGFEWKIKTEDYQSH